MSDTENKAEQPSNDIEDHHENNGNASDDDDGEQKQSVQVVVHDEQDSPVLMPRKSTSNTSKTTTKRNSQSLGIPSVRVEYSVSEMDNHDGESKAKRNKRKKKKLKKINKEHPEFELAYDMMLGIRTTVGKAESKPHRELRQEDFQEEVKLRFLSEGTPLTPAHQMRDFKFKDYCPEVFRQLRERFGIRPADYLVSICGNFEFLEFITNSKSGQFFFYSGNRQFMIKTVSQEESRYLRQILPHYYQHVMDNPNTLLTRFYGMHRVKPHKKRQTHFLIFQSVFHTSKFIHTTFDLKGSLHGRSATAKERAEGNPVWKDKDFLRQKTCINIGPDRAKALKEQITRDVEFLKQLKIMDYSLLLGIHKKRRLPEGEFVREKSDDLLDRRESQAMELGPAEAGLGDDDEKEIVRRQSRYGLPKKYNQINRPEIINFEAPQFEPMELHESKDGVKPQAVKSLFIRDDGGIRSKEADGSWGGEIYYMGIIDVLTTYGVKKRVEHLAKSIQIDGNTISAVNPDAYAERFKKFLFKAIK